MTTGIPKNQVRSRNSIEQHEHEDGADARRVTLVDAFGIFRDANNPLPVKIQDAEININGEFGVKLTDKDNDPDPGNLADAVQIGNGTYRLNINPDGSINVVPQATAQGTYKQIYNEAVGVVSGVTTTVATYVVPALTTAYLEKIDVSGENIAKYTILLNASVISTKRTYFGNALNEIFDLASKNSQGLELQAGDILQVQVLHTRPMISNFEARIQVVEIL